MRTIRPVFLGAISGIAGQRAAAGRIADYVAAGLGLNSGASETSWTTTASFRSIDAHWNSSSSSSSTTSPPSSETPAILLVSPNNASSSLGQAAVTAVPSQHALLDNATYAPGNHSCWPQWESFYALWDKYETTYTTVVPTTVTGQSVSDGSTLWNVGQWITSATRTLWDGAHPYETQTFPTTYVLSVPVWEILTTDTITQTVTTSVYTASQQQFTFPACNLPSHVPACQSSWDHYESEYWKGYSTLVWPTCLPRQMASTDVKRNPECFSAWTSFYAAGNHFASVLPRKPWCSQASIAQSYCSSEGSRLINWGSKLMDLKTANGYTTSILPDGSTTTYWAKDQSLAPGCTFGCQQCQLTGSSVRMFFWPPHTGPVDSIGPPVTAIGLGTTFTSPTVYISFDTIFASDSCSAVGGTYANTILAIPQSTAISSLWGRNEINGFQFTAAFNFSDLLQSPVPNSIYNRQPRCAEAWFQADLQYDLDLYNCSRQYPYNPILMMPAEVRDIDPAWADCGGGIQGVYDPPIALQPAETIALPTIPVAITYGHRPAAPASTPPAAPSQTFAYAPKPTQSKFQHFVFDPMGSANDWATPTWGVQEPTSVDLLSPPSAWQPEPIPSQNNYVQGSSNEQPWKPSPPASVAVVHLGNEDVTAVVRGSTGAIRVGSHALSVDQIVTLQHGQIISAASSGIVVDGQSAAFSRVDPPADDSGPAPKAAVLSVDDEVLTAFQFNHEVVIGSHTLQFGASTIIEDHTFEAGPSGLVYDGQNVRMSAVGHYGTRLHTAVAAVIPLGSATVTAFALPSDRVMIDGQTIGPGQSFTTDDHAIVAHSGFIVVDGSRTVTLVAERPPSSEIEEPSTQNTTSRGGFTMPPGTELGKAGLPTSAPAAAASSSTSGCGRSWASAEWRTMVVLIYIVLGMHVIA